MECYKLPQHPRAIFSWHLDVCKLSVYMVDPIIFLKTHFFNSTKWKNKLLIRNINFTGHSRACCLLLLISLKTWVIAIFWHWWSKVFPKTGMGRRGLFCENCSITDHSLRQVQFNSDALLEICGSCWLQH